MGYLLPTACLQTATQSTLETLHPMKTPEQVMEWAKFYGQTYSHDPDTKVGCGITAGGHEIYGANQLLLPVDDVPPTRLCRPEKYKWIQHAEQNVIGYAARRGYSLEGGTMYLPWFPCGTCAQSIICAGLRKLVCYKPDMTNPKWSDDFRVARTMLEEAGVTIEYVEPV